MAYDFKKEYKDLYLPKVKPSLIEAPAMNFVAVAGTGDPNQNGGFYQQALEFFLKYILVIQDVLNRKISRRLFVIQLFEVCSVMNFQKISESYSLRFGSWTTHLGQD